ncbi:hypothetical protein ABW636_12825 [Aquimarina sp. 2201CG1-2-11]|uniref:hypothetical protein n=1 Tax=Aquimarina discodermiae TaxID=3231043 RepID=UPI0034632B6A
MKNRAITFISFLCIPCILTVSCTSDTDNVTNNDTPIEEVTTSKQYDQVESASREIYTVIERFFNTESGIFGIAGLQNKNSNCPKLTTENDGRSMTISIDYGDGCETPDGNRTAGKIILAFNIEPDGDNKDTTEISYTVENILYDNVSINGSARRSFTYNSEIGNAKYIATSEFEFDWGDGVTATSKSNRVKEIFREENQGIVEEDPYGYGFDFYALTTGSSSTSFNNEDTYSSEITTPLRYESFCGYTVKGVMSTFINKKIVTLDYGDGTCDNKAIQTDSDGNETTIELSW